MHAIAKQYREEKEQELFSAMKKILETERCGEILNEMEHFYLKDIQKTKENATEGEIKNIFMHLRAILIIKSERNKKYEYR